jgi:hypothetical protein
MLSTTYKAPHKPGIPEQGQDRQVIATAQHSSNTASDNSFTDQILYAILRRASTTTSRATITMMDPNGERACQTVSIVSQPENCPFQV